MKERTTVTRFLWALTLLLVIIGTAAVTRRMVQLTFTPAVSSRFPDAAAMDSGFSQHRLLTVMHIVPALVYLLLSPLQFVKRLRTRRPQLHRWLGRVAIAAGVLAGVLAFVMTPQMAIGGNLERSAIVFFGSIFVGSLIRGFIAIRRRDVAHHREWMIRAFAIGSGAATVRPVMGVFFATRSLTHMNIQEFFGIAFWIGFALNAIAAEAWIRSTRVNAGAERAASVAVRAIS